MSTAKRIGTIHATDRDGSVHEIAGREHASVMELLWHAGLSLEARCGGCCECATCHIHVAGEWLERIPPPSVFETATMQFVGVDVQPNSRLACQIGWQAQLDGFELTIAPDD